MSTETEKAVQHAQAGVVNELIIRQMASGEVVVSGPINNKGLCHMLLGEAADAIKDFNAAQAKSPLMLPPSARV